MLGCNEYMIVGVLPDISREIGASLSSLGYLVTVFALVYALSTPLVTSLTRYLKRHQLLYLLLVIFLLGNTWTALSTSYLSLLLSRIMSATTAGAIISLVLVNRHFDLYDLVLACQLLADLSSDGCRLDPGLLVRAERYSPSRAPERPKAACHLQGPQHPLGHLLRHSDLCRPVYLLHLHSLTYYRLHAFAGQLAQPAPAAARRGLHHWQQERRLIS